MPPNSTFHKGTLHAGDRRRNIILNLFSKRQRLRPMPTTFQACMVCCFLTSTISPMTKPLKKWDIKNLQRINIKLCCFKRHDTISMLYIFLNISIRNFYENKTTIRTGKNSSFLEICNNIIFITFGSLYCMTLLLVANHQVKRFKCNRSSSQRILKNEP